MTKAEKNLEQRVQALEKALQAATVRIMSLEKLLTASSAVSKLSGKTGRFTPMARQSDVKPPSAVEWKVGQKGSAKKAASKKAYRPGASKKSASKSSRGPIKRSTKGDPPNL